MGGQASLPGSHSHQFSGGLCLCYKHEILTCMTSLLPLQILTVLSFTWSVPCEFKPVTGSAQKIPVRAGKLGANLANTAGGQHKLFFRNWVNYNQLFSTLRWRHGEALRMLYTGEGGKTSPKRKGCAAQTHKTHETGNTQWESRTCILTFCKHVENKRKSKENIQEGALGTSISSRWFNTVISTMWTRKEHSTLVIWNFITASLAKLCLEVRRGNQVLGKL